MNLTTTKRMLLSGALGCMAPSLLAQATVEFVVEPGLHFDLISINNSLGLSTTAIDFPKGETDFQLDFKRNKRLQVTNGEAQNIFYVRDRHTYTIKVDSVGVEIISEDPYRESLEAADTIFDSYNLTGIDDEVLLARFAQIEARYDSIKSLHPGDIYLHTSLEYSRLKKCIDSAVRSQKGAAVTAFYKSLEKDYIISKPTRFDNPHYCEFIGYYYTQKTRVKAFREYRPEGHDGFFDRFKGEIALSGKEDIAQLATLYFINENCMGQVSSQMVEFNMALVSIRQNITDPYILITAMLLQTKLDQISAGMPVANHRFIDTTGGTIQLSDFKGAKYVLLDFWTVRCRPCKQHIPRLKALHTDYGNELEIIAVNPVDSMKHVTAYQTGNNLPYVTAVPEAYDEIRKELTVLAFPTYILIDKEGRTVLFAGPEIEKVQAYMEKNRFNNAEK